MTFAFVVEIVLLLLAAGFFFWLACKQQNEERAVWETAWLTRRKRHRKLMHGTKSEAIQAAFDAASARNEARQAPTPDESDFYDLMDLCYDTDRIEPDTVEAAFAQGQKFSQADRMPGLSTESRYTCWWGSTVVWFIGTEQDIIKRLEAFQPK